MKSNNENKQTNRHIGTWIGRSQCLPLVKEPESFQLCSCKVCGGQKSIARELSPIRPDPFYGTAEAGLLETRFLDWGAAEGIEWWT